MPIADWLPGLKTIVYRCGASRGVCRSGL